MVIYIGGLFDSLMGNFSPEKMKLSFVIYIGGCWFSIVPLLGQISSKKAKLYFVCDSNVVNLILGKFSSEMAKLSLVLDIGGCFLNIGPLLDHCS